MLGVSTYKYFVTMQKEYLRRFLAQFSWLKKLFLAIFYFVFKAASFSLLNFTVIVFWLHLILWLLRDITISLANLFNRRFSFLIEERTNVKLFSVIVKTYCNQIKLNHLKKYLNTYYL